MRLIDLLDVLQGILTNDVAHAMRSSGDNGCQLYSHLLNSKGRYMHDMFLHADVKRDSDIFLDVDRQSIGNLMKVLRMYALRQSVSIDDVSGELEVWTRGQEMEKLSEDVVLDESRLMFDWKRDPRLRELGERVLRRVDASMADTGSGARGSAASNSKDPHAKDRYKRLRYILGVAEGDQEISRGNAISLEYNLDGLNGISFTKGCYVGQELMARTHFQGMVRKRLMPFEIVLRDGDVSIADNETLVDENEKKIGEVRGSNGRYGIALVRLSAIENCSGCTQTSKGMDVRLFKPSWWPEEW